MNVQVKKGVLAEQRTEAVLVVQFEGDTRPAGIAARLDEKSGGLIGELISRGDVSGRLNEIRVAYPGKGVPAKRFVVVGLGKRADVSLERIRGAFSKAAQHIRALRVTEFATTVDFRAVNLPLAQTAEAAVEGVILGLYRFVRFKTTDRNEEPEVRGITIVEEQPSALRVVRTAVKTAVVVSRAALFARDLVSAPANEMTPKRLADTAVECSRGRNIACTVLEEAALRKLGMHALLGVAAGSDEAPRFIIMEYRGGGKSAPVIALVGKGITFDSGGISIKSADKLDQMKSDMAGGAAVIAAVRAAADLALPVNIVGLVPAVENLPSGRAYKPGDILTSLSGQTIEVVTTDAEGRLILADALAYAGRYRPAAIIDVATLTGACIVALGDHVSGMFGSNDELKRAIREAADFTGERVWELPLWDEYDELIRGDAADYKNSGGRAGGAVTAAVFLSKFTTGCPWVHLDIAGPAWLIKERPYIPKGASGVGVRLLVQFLRNRGGTAPVR
ncbi:MAG: leucyl aminopeptidase [Syntrophales bacterium]